MRKTDRQLEILEWFLEFTSFDLESLSEREFEKVAIDASHYFGELGDFFLELGFLPSHPFRKAVFLVVVTQRENLISIRQELVAFLRELQSSDGKYWRLAPKEWRFGIDSRGIMRVGPRLSASEKITVQRFKKFLKLGLFLLLNGIPQEAIRLCEECCRFFLHLSKKLKIYCSSVCSSRGTSRKKREADPERYRQQQREIMRLHYRQKKAKKLGIPVEKVKIKKRVKD